MASNHQIAKAVGLLVVAASAIFLFQGCGGADYDGPQRVAVQGTVTLDGNPLPYGILRFTPGDQGSRPASAGVLDGKYSLPEEQGPNLGKYSVLIVGYDAAPEGGGEDGDDEEEEEEELDDEAAEEADPDNLSVGEPIARAEQEVEIVADQDTYDFSLSSSE